MCILTSMIMDSFYVLLKPSKDFLPEISDRNLKTEFIEFRVNFNFENPIIVSLSNNLINIEMF